jgi:hypothetical protein
MMSVVGSDPAERTTLKLGGSFSLDAGISGSRTRQYEAHL